MDALNSEETNHAIIAVIQLNDIPIICERKRRILNVFAGLSVSVALVRGFHKHCDSSVLNVLSFVDELLCGHVLLILESTINSSDLATLLEHDFGDIKWLVARCF